MNFNAQNARKALYFLVFAGILFVVYPFIPTQNTENNTVTGNKVTSWSTYTDDEFDFFISYPSTLQKTTFTREKEVEFGRLIKDISFHPNTGGPGQVGVKIYSNLTFDNLEDFFKLKNNEREFVKYEIEGEFMVGAIPATVFHAVSVGPEGQEEHFLFTRYAVFVKNGKLFQIWTGFNDKEAHQRVWDSFRFADD